MRDDGLWAPVAQSSEVSDGTGMGRTASLRTVSRPAMGEPSGLLTDQHLIAVPGFGGKFLKVWAHVESEKVAWNAEAVVAPLPN